MILSILGTSTPQGKFFGTCDVLSSHEDEGAWASIYKFIKESNINPSYYMGDGAKAISNASKNVFTSSTSRLMCWSHVHRNITPRLKPISTLNKSVSEKILNDIMDIQWSALNEKTFRKLFELMEKKYVGKHEQVLDGLIRNFFSYMHKVWIQSEEFKWYEGAHPWQVSNNQGVEGCNKEIKQSHTFRRRLDIGELVSVLARLVEEWSEVDDKLLESSRLSLLEGEKTSLALKTSGYQWFMKNKNKPDRIMKISPKNKYSVSASTEFQLGSLDSLWVVSTISGGASGKPLKERAKERIANRAEPTVDDFDEFMQIRKSCWILEERGGDYFCDCPVGMKVCFMYS